jgi:hypothetical protein
MQSSPASCPFLPLRSNFGGETSLEMSTCKTKNEMEDNIKEVVKEVDYEVERWMVPVQDHVQWQALVSVMLKLRVLPQC